MAGPPSITIPPSSGKGKKPKRPPGPAASSYVAGRLLSGSGSAWRPYYSLIEREARLKLGSSQWAVFVLAQLIAENPGGPPQGRQGVIDEVTADITQTGGVSDGANRILQGATGGGLLPVPPSLPIPGKTQRAAKTALYNGWATIGKNGKLTPSTDPTPPKNTVTFNGLPITVAQFNSYWKQLNSVYIAYTGKGASAQQVGKILTSGVDLKYTLPKQLMMLPGFRNSPVWKSSIDGYREAWSRVYGNQEKPDLGAIQRAMANRVSPTDFMYTLKYRADYTRSEQYLSNSSVMLKQYEAIYGKADRNGLDLVHQATLAGWDPEQFATYLRKQPGYTRSSEYQSKLIGFLGALSLVTGGEPELTNVGAQSAPLTGGAPPPDARVPSPSAAPEPLSTLATYGVGPSGTPPTPFRPATNPGAP